MIAGLPAAPLAALLLFGLAAFYGALSLGAPLGAYAWGGQPPGPLSPRLQLGSVLLTPICAAMAMILLVRGGILFAGNAEAMVWPVWGVFCFQVTTMFGSLRSTSRPERRITTPVLAIGVILTGIVAFNTGA